MEAKRTALESIVKKPAAAEASKQQAERSAQKPRAVCRRGAGSRFATKPSEDNTDRKFQNDEKTAQAVRRIARNYAGFEGLPTKVPTIGHFEVFWSV